VSKCLQSWLETTHFLSTRKGDNSCPGTTGNIEKSLVLIKKQSILLARSIKTAHKKANLFQNWLFTVFLLSVKFLSI
jgi:hypothetical protein